MCIELKIKLLHLAAETRIIKNEEQRLKRKAVTGSKYAPAMRQTLNKICHHRKLVVRPHARSTNLAYGYLRGRTRSQIENPTTLRRHPNKGEVQRMVERYGTKEQRTGFNKWWDEVDIVDKAA